MIICLIQGKRFPNVGVTKTNIDVYCSNIAVHKSVTCIALRIGGQLGQLPSRNKKFRKNQFFSSIKVMNYLGRSKFLHLEQSKSMNMMSNQILSQKFFFGFYKFIWPKIYFCSFTTKKKGRPKKIFYNNFD